LMLSMLGREEVAGRWDSVGWQIGYLHGCYLGCARTSPEPAHERLHRRILTTCNDFHATVGEITRVAADRQLPRTALGCAPIKHSLHAAGYETLLTSQPERTLRAFAHPFRTQ